MPSLQQILKPAALQDEQICDLVLYGTSLITVGGTAAAHKEQRHRWNGMLPVIKRIISIVGLTINTSALMNHKQS